ncbi:MAG: hypothetical protein U5L09_14895 [Bacteroidales bacterium]|nr:hypothetical protein [Bacteroidales bacterium]
MKQLIRFSAIIVFGILISASHLMAQKQRAQKAQPKKILIENAADTLFHFDGFYYSVNGTDFPDFEMLFQDRDSLNPSQDYYEDSDWHFYYDALGGGDTLNWVEATAWFSPPGQADDWITMGPLTIPSDGATFSWRAYHNPVYRNGYEVKISTTGIQPEDFTAEPMYVVEDLIDENSENIDTNRMFQDPPKSFEMPDSVAGEQVFVAMHHHADDMDAIHFSDFVLKSNPTAIPERVDSFAHLSAYPNPASNRFHVFFHTAASSVVTFRLTDLFRQRPAQS